MATINKRGRTWQLNWSDEDGQHRISLGRVSKQEAEIRRKEKELECATGRPYSLRSIAFADFATEYLAWYADHYPSTYERTAGIFEHSLLPHFGRLPMEQMTPRDVNAWLVWRKIRPPKPPSPGTVSKEARALFAMVNKAVEWRTLAENPLRGATAPPERQSKAPEFYTREQLQRLYKASPFHVDIWRFMANTGLRRNEALYLRRGDIGTDAIRVQSLEETPTKSRRWRSVPINAAAAEAIAALARRWTDSEPPQGGDAGYLLPRMDPRSLSRAFAKCAKRANLPGSLHTLRHSFVSHLVMAGVDLATVQKIAGHATITTTMRYAHLSQEHAQAAIQRIAL